MPVFLCYALYINTSTSLLSVYAPPLVVVSLMGAYHFTRSDSRFLFHITDYAYLFKYVEYLVFSSPFLIVFLLKGNYAGVVIQVVLLFVISVTPIPHIVVSSFTFAGKLAPAACFEWISGIRKNFIPLAFLYFLAFALVYFKFASLVVLWLIIGIVAGFYFECESVQILICEQKNAGQFVRHKIHSHLRLMLLYFAPVVVVYTIFHPEHYWLSAAFLCVCSINLVFFVVIKYAAYKPNENLNANSIFTVIAIMSVFIPVLLPIPLLMSVRGYYRSISNLKEYLYDFD